MRYLTIPVDDVVYERLVQRAQQEGESVVELYVRDVLRSHTRRKDTPMSLPQPIPIDKCALELSLPGVYAVYHRKRERWYIGSSGGMARRITAHVTLLRAGKHYNQRLQEDWVRDGEEAFAWMVIDFLPGASRDTIRDREYAWMHRIRKEQGIDALYNKRMEYDHVEAWKDKAD